VLRADDLGEHKLINIDVIATGQVSVSKQAVDVGLCLTSSVKVIRPDHLTSL